MDLCNTTCVIEYINAEQKARIYPVPFYDISSYPGKMLIPWNVGAGATVKKGTIQYSIKFYKLDPLGTKFEYNFNLLPATSEVLHGMDGASFDTEDFILTAD
jgi:hypothetical protein